MSTNVCADGNSRIITSSQGSSLPPGVVCLAGAVAPVCCPHAGNRGRSRAARGNIHKPRGSQYLPCGRREGLGEAGRCRSRWAARQPGPTASAAGVNLDECWQRARVRCPGIAVARCGGFRWSASVPSTGGAGNPMKAGCLQSAPRIGGMSVVAGREPRLAPKVWEENRREAVSGSGGRPTGRPVDPLILEHFKVEENQAFKPPVTPAKAGVQRFSDRQRSWIPACAGNDYGNLAWR